MRFDDRAANRQPQPQAVRLGRMEGLEEVLESTRVALATFRGGPNELEIAERQVRVKCLTVAPPGIFVWLQVGHLPASPAELGVSVRRIAETFGELLPDEAMLRIGLPVDLEGELHERAKALLALAQRLLR